MEIKTASILSAETILMCNGEKWDVIVITNSDTWVSAITKKYAKSYLQLVFDDVDCPLGSYIVPSEIDVENALSFAEGKERLLVTCYGGLTRSVALAYVIKCKLCGDPQEAIKMLIPILHHPNRKIIKIGAEILGNRSIFDTYADWASSSRLFFGSMVD